MTPSLRRLSNRFFDLEERLFRTSQIPPIERMARTDSASCQIFGFTNPFSFQILSTRPDLMDAVDHWYSDGGLLCRTVGWGRGGRLPRYSFDFSSIAHDIFDHAERATLPLALLGSTEEELGSAQAYLQARYPRLRIVWSRNGFFREAGLPDGGRAAALDALAASGAGLVIIGMGTPLQEETAVHLKRLVQARADGTAGIRTIFTCGGFLSQTAQGDYYPKIVKKTGLRWVYRAVHERHVRQRLLQDYPRFAALVAACWLHRAACRLSRDRA